MKKRRRTSCRHRNPIIRFIAKLRQSMSVHALLTGVLILFGVYVILIYVFVFSPLTTSWRGIFGDSLIPEGFSNRCIDIIHNQCVIDC